MYAFSLYRIVSRALVAAEVRRKGLPDFVVILLTDSAVVHRPIGQRELVARFEHAR